MGARPPRALFSAPSRKIPGARKGIGTGCGSPAPEPGAGVLPKFGIRVSVVIRLAGQGQPERPQAFAVRAGKFDRIPLARAGLRP